jgi:hypothetical protein
VQVTGNLLANIRLRLADKFLSEAIADAVASLEVDYTALNLMLSNGRDLYTQKFQKSGII